MDAREYLARKGLDGSRDDERPNTLEEKAWDRARHAGGHKPRAGTPYDWEEWERYHEELAEGADGIEQKIDHEAHRQAHERAKRKQQHVSGVQEYIPSPDDGLPPASGTVTSKTSTVSPAWQVSPALRFAFKALAIMLPPLAVGLAQGGARRVVVSLLLTLLGWLPGCLYAWRWLNRQ
ncbi:YqaE/Pmp3 family membrane protein [Billgrantia kenyensis]|uniref:YqaE/Pmp3 family membrane protein n=1 Tax=Billgrantia kenyensis TaxID=321266 RepID=A0A7W0AEY0_9GAMM|nr:YqaE/Pmp3 family membrane protein [Halomonas kenyensis]MCG6662975.1 YqaE/Pmp3 family membrane protein [Halomonas kenyensis]